MPQFAACTSAPSFSGGNGDSDEAFCGCFSPLACKEGLAGRMEIRSFPRKLLSSRNVIGLTQLLLLINLTRCDASSSIIAVGTLKATTGLEKAGASALADEMTPLQKHADFFDRNKDGVIYLSETYQGLRAIGFGMTTSSTMAVLIHSLLGPLTQPGKAGSLSSPLPAVYVSNIQKGKHGSDTGAYDSEGRFVSEKFEAIFEKHAKTNPNFLSSSELMDMLKANRIPKNYAGWAVAKIEWKLLYSLCKDKDGNLSKEDIKAVYDGSLFYRLEQRASKKRSGV